MSHLDDTFNLHLTCQEGTGKYTGSIEISI